MRDWPTARSHVDHFLHLAQRFGNDLAVLERDQLREFALCRAVPRQTAAPFPALRGRTSAQARQRRLHLQRLSTDSMYEWQRGRAGSIAGTKTRYSCRCAGGLHQQRDSKCWHQRGDRYVVMIVIPSVGALPSEAPVTTTSPETSLAAAGSQ